MAGEERVRKELTSYHKFRHIGEWVPVKLLVFLHFYS